MIEYTEYDIDFLKLSEGWLSDSEVKLMTNTPDITPEKQQLFFNSLPNRDDYKIWGVKYNGKPIGAVGLKNITCNEAEYWGYIGEKKYWGMGIGKHLMDFAAEKAQELGLKAIYLSVRKDNIRAYRLYVSKGYVLQSDNDVMIIMKLEL